jgi:hypothetical protein
VDTVIWQTFLQEAYTLFLVFLSISEEGNVSAQASELQLYENIKEHKRMCAHTRVLTKKNQQKELHVIKENTPENNHFMFK